MNIASAPARRPALLPWLPGYQGPWLRSDLVAGLITAAVVLPQAMAYASLAGLPLQYGLYTALVPMALYAIFASSRPLSVSTTSTISLLTATAIASAPDGSDPIVVATTLAVMAGMALLLGRLFRLGFLEDFISRPILAGFKVGMGVTIAVSQLGKLLGYDVAGSSFGEKIASALSGLDQTSLATLAISVAAIGGLVVLRRFDKRVPGPLIVLAAGMALVALAGIEDRGVATVSPVPGGLPPLTLPDLALVRDLLPPALAIALMSFIESMAAGRSFRGAEDPPVEADRELVALGAANLGGGLFGAYGAGGGLSQTAVNDDAGARSQVSSLVVAVVTVGVLVLFTGVLRFIPEAVLGAVVLMAAVGLMDTTELRRIRSMEARDFAFGLVTVLVVLAEGAVVGLLVGLLVSLITLIFVANHAAIRVLGWERDTHLYRDHELHPDDATMPGLLVIRPESGLYFGNAHRFADRVEALVDEADPRPRVLLVDMSVVAGLDTTAVSVMIEHFRLLGSRGVEVWYAALTDTALGEARRVPEWRKREGEAAFRTLDEAVAAFEERHGPEPKDQASSRIARPARPNR